MLYANAQFSAAALKTLLGALGPHCVLRRLDLCGAAGLSDDALAALLPVQDAGQMALRELNLTWCPLLSDASLAPLLSKCCSLEWLSLHGNTNVGPSVLDALAGAASHSLHTLDVRGCTAMPAEQRAPDALRRRMPRLRVFKVHS